jgi:hypothetical protein
LLPRSSHSPTASSGPPPPLSTPTAGRGWILHPIREWDGERLIGWVGTGPSPTKQAHLNTHPYVSLTYWDSSHDTATAQCRASLHTDEETRTEL